MDFLGESTTSKATLILNDYFALYTTFEHINHDFKGSINPTSLFSLLLNDIKGCKEHKDLVLVVEKYIC